MLAHKILCIYKCLSRNKNLKNERLFVIITSAKLCNYVLAVRILKNELIISMASIEIDMSTAKCNGSRYINFLTVTPKSYRRIPFRLLFTRAKMTGSNVSISTQTF